MTEPVRDPEGIETSNVVELVRLDQADVLEIGSGNGRLTWRYAGLAGRVAAVDTAADQLDVARRDRPAALAGKVSIIQASAEALPFRKHRFDVALLAWSL